MPMRAPRHRAPRHDGVKQHAVPRPSSHARGYADCWQRLSRWYRRRHPVCADPFGVHGSRCEPGAHVDHIVALTRGGTNEESNLQTLCVSCHSRNTVLFDGGLGNVRGEGDGGKLIPWG